MHRTFEALRQELLELRRHDEQILASLRQLQDELRLAGRIQRDLLHSPIPSVRGATVRVMHRAAGDVSGDVYHVARLDASRIMMLLADATGHGFAAGLLSAFVARSVTSAMHNMAADPGMPAGELLKRLNENLLDARVCEGHFVTALTAVYHEDLGELQWARAGAPFPVLVRPSNGPRLLRSGGILLGVDHSADFETCNVKLSPGDLIVFHTDGVEAGTHAPWLPEDPERRMDEIVSSPDQPKDDVTAILLRAG
jgi:sigma-B regulation protein RsbU (phosphoserine phosphatase)